MPPESAPIYDPELNAWDLESVEVTLHAPEQDHYPRARTGRPVPARPGDSSWIGDDFAPAEHPTVH